MGALKALSTVQANCILYDGNENLTKEDVMKKLPEGCHAEICIGKLREDVLHSLDMAVVSPGVTVRYAACGRYCYYW